MFLNKLPTANRLCSWGLNVLIGCLLCGDDVECRNHIFFTCDLSKQVWQLILQKCGLSKTAMDWSKEVKWAICRIKRKSLLSKALKCA